MHTLLPGLSPPTTGASWDRKMEPEFLPGDTEAEPGPGQVEGQAQQDRERRQGRFLPLIAETQPATKSLSSRHSGQVV